jgi:tRNA threonylcarbamoyl adenosine modification protein YeaZ
MKSILVDTSGKLLSVTLSENNEFVAGLSVETNQKMNESLLPSLISFLNSFNLTFNDIEKYFIIVGPGSFTGIRIGVATLLGITTALNKDLKGISSLDAAALSNDHEIITVATFLRGKEVVYKNYNFQKNIFSDYKFTTEENLPDKYINPYKINLDLSKALLNNKFDNFIRDYLPFYMRKSEAEISFDKKSTLN